jgi:hypothetical protein
MIGTYMTEQSVNAGEFDAWRSDGNLDRIRAPARHVIAAWVLAAALALAIVLGPPATRQAEAGLVALRHEILILDHEFKRVSVRLQSGDRA